MLAQYWDQLGQAFDPSSTDHAETVKAVKQITGGNFRLIERLMSPQVARVMAINQLEAITIHVSGDFMNTALRKAIGPALHPPAAPEPTGR